MYIKRTVEDVVARAAASFKAVLVTGARQTGKTTLLRTLDPNRRILSFDDQFLEDQAKENPAMFLTLNDGRITLDEVQRVPSLFRPIKMKCDASEENGVFMLSGSQPFKLMHLASDSLAGRIAIIELAPLSLRELTGSDFTDPFVPTMEYVKARERFPVKTGNIWNIIHRGGYPRLQEKNVGWQMYFASYVKTYLERDVRELSSVQNLELFRKFMIACAARTGQILNYSNIADEVGKDAGTIKNWISILEASGVVYLLEPYHASVLKRTIKAPKLYFRDTGLAAYLTRWLTPETLANGAMSGAFFETFVISEILKSYSNRGLDYRYFVSYYRGKDKIRQDDSIAEREIDLIIEENGVLHPIEIKKSAVVDANMTKAFQVIDKIKSKKRGTGAVVSTGAAPGFLRENVLSIPVSYL